MASQNPLPLFVLLLLLVGIAISAEKIPEIPAYKFAEIEIPLIEFEEAHPIEVLNYIFAEAHRIRPDLKDVVYSFSPQAGQMSTPTPVITGSYRGMATADAFREMTGLCKWSFFIDGNIYRFTNSREFYLRKYWPELENAAENKNGD